MSSMDEDSVDLESPSHSEAERSNPPIPNFDRPVSDWPFEPETESTVRLILAKYVFEVVEADEEELFCSCMGVDDGTPMILCNEAKCLRQWYHLRCIDMENLPNEDGKSISDHLRQRLMTVDDWYCDRCIGRDIKQDDDEMRRFETNLTNPHLRHVQALSPSLAVKFRVNSKEAGTLLPLKLSTSLVNPKSLGLQGKESWSAPLFRNSPLPISPKIPDPRSTVSDSFPIIKRTRTKPRTTLAGKSEWSIHECEEMKKFMRKLVASGTHKTEQKWVLASQHMKNLGMQRSPNSCKMIWMRKLRAETGIDERVQGRKQSLVTGTWTKNRKRALDEEKKAAAAAKRMRIAQEGKEGLDKEVKVGTSDKSNEHNQKRRNEKGRNGQGMIGNKTEPGESEVVSKADGK